MKKKIKCNIQQCPYHSCTDNSCNKQVFLKNYKNAEAEYGYGHCIDDILRNVADYLAIPNISIMHGGQIRELADARKLLWKLLRELHNFTYVKIAYITGHHHSTIMHGIEQIDYIPQLKEQFEIIKVSCELFYEYKNNLHSCKYH